MEAMHILVPDTKVNVVSRFFVYLKTSTNNNLEKMHIETPDIYTK